MERQWDESSARQVRSLLQPTNFFFEILFHPSFGLARSTASPKRVSDGSDLELCWLFRKLFDLTGLQTHNHSSLHAKNGSTKLLVVTNPGTRRGAISPNVEVRHLHAAIALGEELNFTKVQIAPHPILRSGDRSLEIPELTVDNPDNSYGKISRRSKDPWQSRKWALPSAAGERLTRHPC